MGKIRIILYSVLVYLNSFGLNAQDKIDVGIIFIPSITNIHANHDLAPFENLFTINYGMKASFVKEKFAFSTGIFHFTQGAQFQGMTSSVNLPEQPSKFFDVFIRTKAVIIPLSVDYLLNITEKTQLFAGLGFYPGYIYSQQMENTSIPENYQPDPFYTPAYPVKRFNDVDMFNEFYLGINAGIGLKQTIFNKFSVQLRPNLLYQIRKKLKPVEKYAWTNRLMSYSIEVGVFYRFNGKHKQ